MPGPSRRTLAAVAVAALCAGAPALAAANRPWQPAPFDRNLSADTHHENGEPSIAINPANPRNVIVIYLSNNDAFVPNLAKGQLQPPSTRDAEQQIQGCDYAVTFDGGKTWTRKPLPANDFNTDPTENNCSDSIVVFDARGTAYVMASAYASLGFVGDSEYRLISSRDGGRTWSKPAVVAPGMIGQGSHPQDYDGVRTYDDRPWLTIDPTTRDLFIDGTQVRADGQGNRLRLSDRLDGRWQALERPDRRPRRTPRQRTARRGVRDRRPRGSNRRPARAAAAASTS